LPKGIKKVKENKKSFKTLIREIEKTELNQWKKAGECLRCA
jgi:hypothetical protein